MLNTRYEWKILKEFFKIRRYDNHTVFINVKKLITTIYKY